MEGGPVTQLLEFGMLACALGVGFAVVPTGRGVAVRWLTHGFAAIGSLLLTVGAVLALVSGKTLDLGHYTLVAGLSDLRFVIDPLSAFFLLLISGIGFAVSIYAIGYASGSSFLGGMFTLFLGSMAGLVLAGDGLSFLLAWELMSLVSFMLVMAEHKDKEVRQAGYFYVVMTHLGTAFLFGAFLTLFAHTGSLAFADWQAAAPQLSAGIRGGLFLAALVGFGTKAGLVPLHVWLPKAHPAAPSHVSALMSGVMVKTAVYGMLRLAFDVLGGGPAWWGAVVVAVGAISAVTGVLYATQQSHLKRLLAFSTVENIGLLFMGIGAALWAKATGLFALETLALGAVLFHALSHAAFKGLAFMGAGAVLHGVGTVEMEKLGGLMRKMPRTAAFFLVAALAIAGLPPLSGFMGEWLSLQTFLQLAAVDAQSTMGRLGAMAAVAAIALAAGLAAATAVKAFGMTFLALPRSKVVEHAHDANGMMVAGMALPAVAILALGFFPSRALALAGQVTHFLQTSVPAPASFAVDLSHTASELNLQVQPLLTPVTLVVLAAVLLLAVLVIGRGWPKWRRDLTWTCGIAPTARMEYSAAGQTKPILLMFRGLLQPVRALEVDKSTHPLFPGRVHYESEVAAVFDQRLYRPVTRTVMSVATRLRRIQTGSLQTYLLYLLLAAVVVIVAAR